ncbi:MAG: argininosuccinate lyase [Christensenellaceae bacterium]|nr:argininosuccinate lyase [Christensenellaceae bacterium]
MSKLWAGRFSKQLDSEVNDFNSSIPFDSRMAQQDIRGSVAHVTMLMSQGIVSKADGASIVATLGEIAEEIEKGILEIDMTCEDIHTFVEDELTKRIGDVGKRLHTARSRNDQVALDVRLYLLEQTDEIIGLVRGLVKTVTDAAEKYSETILPGYTHLQRAQPITFGQHLMAYAMMLLRDIDRLKDCRKRMNISPLGSCALAGTTYNTNRGMVAELLGMDGISMNSLDGVSDRDFCLELASAISIIMMHLSRFSEEVILWCSWEFKYIELDDAYSTGSSIMPQKKNPDIAELVRGKTGRAYGDMVTLFTMLKGLPLAYNKDMQEDKEAIFDSVDTVKQCLSVFAPMIATMRVNADNMRNAAAKGFINATDCADYLVTKGLPFRSAYKVTGELVAYCIREEKTLETLSLDEYKQFHELFDEKVYQAIDMKNCVYKRISQGGTSPEEVKKQVAWAREQLGE